MSQRRSGEEKERAVQWRVCCVCEEMRGEPCDESWEGRRPQGPWKATAKTLRWKVVEFLAEKSII